MAAVLLIIPPERFRDEELFETQAALLEAGHATVIASTHTGTCPGSRGGTAHAALTLDEVVPAAYAAVVIIGGGGAKLLYPNARVHEIARELFAAGKIVAAICLAPVILANAGLLRGKQATVAGTEAKTLSAQGATYMGPGVTVDGKIVTANAPKAAPKFAAAINALLSASPAPD
jgi:protease I